MDLEIQLTVPSVVNLDAMPEDTDFIVMCWDGDLSVNFNTVTITDDPVPDVYMVVLRGGAIVLFEEYEITFDTDASRMTFEVSPDFTIVQPGDMVVFLYPELNLSFDGTPKVFPSFSFPLQILPETEPDDRIDDIIAELEDIAEDISDTESIVRRILGLVHENIVVEYTTEDDRHVSSVVKTYSEPWREEESVMDDFSTYTPGSIDGQSGPLGTWDGDATVATEQLRLTTPGTSQAVALQEGLMTPRLGFEWSFECIVPSAISQTPLRAVIAAEDPAQGQLTFTVEGDAFGTYNITLGGTLLYGDADSPTSVRVVFLDNTNVQIYIDDELYLGAVECEFPFIAAIHGVRFANEMLFAGTTVIDNVELVNPEPVALATYDLSVEYDEDGHVSRHQMDRREET